MPAWSLLAVGDPDSGDWFARRFADAVRALIGVDVDTVIGSDFGETITAELVDTVGIADASPVAFYNGGVVAVSVGDAVVAPSAGRLQLTAPPSHVGDLATKPFYMASLVRIIRPSSDDEMGQTRCDAIALWGDDSNGIALGILGNASGGSVFKWVGSINNAASISTVLGPNLDGSESPVWHLFECWRRGALVYFRIDGVAFDDQLPASDLPAMPVALGMRFQRDAIGEQVVPNFDKIVVIVQSPQVGEAS